MNTQQQHIDKDGFRLPESIPLDLWQEYLQIMQQRKVPITNRCKSQWVLSLLRLHNKHQNLRLVMQQSITKQWFGFYSV